MLQKFSVILFMVHAFSLHAQIAKEDCGIESIHCWEKVFISKGIYYCSDWEYKVNEDFSGDSLNRKIWKTVYDTDNRIHLDCNETLYLDSNVEVKDNKIFLKGKVAHGTEWTDSRGRTFVRDFTGSTLQGLIGYHFGKYEAKVLQMPGPGWKSALWMWHHEEIDIMEWQGLDQTYFYNSIPSNDCSVSHAMTIDGSMYEGEHKFGVDWTPFKITWFYNEKPLPAQVYRFHHLDGRPLDFECGDSIPEGTYYLNPNFIIPFRYTSGGNVHPIWFRHIFGCAALPRYGNECCDINLPCNMPGCEKEQCNNWGSPIDNDGNHKPGKALETALIVDSMVIRQRKYRTYNSILFKIDENICAGEEFVAAIENFGNMNENHLAKIDSFSLSSNLQPTGSKNHEWYFLATDTGDAHIVIYYKDDYLQPRVMRRSFVIHESGGAGCSVDICSEDVKNECCPPNTIFQDGKCVYQNIPTGFIPEIHDNTFYVRPNCDIQLENNCCPPGFSLIDGLCHSGITFPSLYSPELEDTEYFAVLLRCPPDQKISVFPNPAYNLLHVDFSFYNRDVIRIRIYDALGRLHHSFNIENLRDPVFSVDIGRLSSGFYFLGADDGVNKEVVRFVKMK